MAKNNGIPEEFIITKTVYEVETELRKEIKEIREQLLGITKVLEETNNILSRITDIVE